MTSTVETAFYQGLISLLPKISSRSILHIIIKILITTETFIFVLHERAPLHCFLLAQFRNGTVPSLNNYYVGEGTMS
jgi:hypothetical protein